MEIKKYLDFIKEELVFGIESNDKTNNIFKNFFNSSKLELKEFLQSKMPNQNLKFLGSGSVGLAFEWSKSPQLPDSFFSSQDGLKFIGHKTNYEGKVIKFTADQKEVNATIDIMEKTNGGKNTLDSFVNFFWIKEVELDKKYQKKIASLWKEEEKRLQDLLNNRRLKSSNKKQEIPKVDLEKRKSVDVTETVFIICLEKLEMLNNNQKMMTLFFNTFLGFIDVFDPKTNIIEVVYNWIMLNDNENFDFWGDGNYGVSLKLKKEFRNENVTFDEFETFIRKLCKVFSDGKKYDIPVTDIHADNLGFRGDDLVAFDCM